MVDNIARVFRSRESAKASYNRLSKWYDWISGGTERKFQEMGLKMLDAGEGERILEIGFGTGHCLVSMAQSLGKAGRVFGLDISVGMLSVARRRLEQARIVERVSLLLGDGLALPFEASSFDAIFMSFTLELFDLQEIPLVLHECLRVVRRGGRFCVAALSKQRRCGMVTLYEWFHRAMPDIVDCQPILVRQVLEDSGLITIEALDSSLWGLPVEIVLTNRP